MDGAPSCTVVIPTTNRPDLLEGCLGAAARLKYPRFELLVVASAPRDDASAEVARLHGAGYVAEPQPGASRARNRGARTCRTDIVVYLDDDACPDPDWLAQLARGFADPRVGAVTGRVLPYRLDEDPDTALLQERMGMSCFGGTARRVIDRETPGWFELAHGGGIGIGPNMSFRRSVFDGWSGFDERVGPGTLLCGGEEGLAFFDLLRRGHRIVYVPEALVRHPTKAIDRAATRRRYLHQLATCTAYFTQLLVEHAGFRRATLRYLAEGAVGRRRTFRAPAPPLTPGLIPRWQILLAYCQGPLLYARMRLQG